MSTLVWGDATTWVWYLKTVCVLDFLHSQSLWWKQLNWKKPKISQLGSQNSFSNLKQIYFYWTKSSWLRWWKHSSQILIVIFTISTDAPEKFFIKKNPPQRLGLAKGTTHHLPGNGADPWRNDLLANPVNGIQDIWVYLIPKWCRFVTLWMYINV